MLDRKETTFALLAVAMAFAIQRADAATPEQIKAFAPYQAIIDRQPFGKPPPPVAVVAPPTKEEQEMAQQEQQLANQIGMSAINNTHDGIMVGFYDNGVSPAKNYYMAIGETAGEFTLVDASLDDETATIEKNGVTVTLKLGEGPQKATPGGRNTSQGPRAAGGARPVRLTPPSEGGSASAGTRPAATTKPGEAEEKQMSHSERLRSHRDAMRRERMEQARALREEAMKAAAENAAAVIADEKERMRQELDEALNNAQIYTDEAQADDGVQYADEADNDPQ